MRSKQNRLCRRPAQAKFQKPAAGGGRSRNPRRSIHLVLPATLFLCLTAAHPTCAQEQPEAYSVWDYSFYKTATYAFFTNLADVALYYTVLRGSGAGSVLFTTVNAGSAAATFYAYEVAWNFFGTPVSDLPPGEAVETGIRKALLYRVVSTARNVVLGYAFSGSAAATVSFVLVSAVVDSAIYLANEHGWYGYTAPSVTPTPGLSRP